MTKRDMVMTIPCPQCGAAHGEACLTVRPHDDGSPRHRSMLHQSRWDVYRSWLRRR